MTSYRMGVDMNSCVVVSTAKFSACRSWRYVLTRIWTLNAPLVMFCALNPFVADEKANDPTVARCVGYAQRWGYGGLL